MPYPWGWCAWTQPFGQQLVTNLVHIQVVNLSNLLSCHMDICRKRGRQCYFQTRIGVFKSSFEAAWWKTHLDNLCQLDFGISGLCWGVHTVKQSDLLVSQWTLDAPHCSSYLLSGYFLLLLSCTGHVSSSGEFLLCHVTRPSAKTPQFYIKSFFYSKAQEKSSFYRLDSRICSSQVSPHLYPQVFFSADTED